MTVIRTYIVCFKDMVVTARAHYSQPPFKYYNVKNGGVCLVTKYTYYVEREF